MVRWSAGAPVWSALKGDNRAFIKTRITINTPAGKIRPKLYITGGTPRITAAARVCLIGGACYSLVQRPVSFRRQLKCPQSLVLVAHSDACVGHHAELVVSDHRRRSSHPKLHPFYLIIRNSAVMSIPRPRGMF